MSGISGLNKSGAGALTIEVDLDSTGDTTVSEGTLTLKGNSTLDGRFTNDATVVFDGTTKLRGQVTNNDTVITRGTTTTTSSVTNNGTITIEGNTTMTGELTNNGTVTVEGTATLTRVISIDGEIIITDSGKLNLTTLETITSKGNNQGPATVKGSPGDSYYSVTSTNYEISNATVTSTGYTTVIKNKLTNTTVVNNSDYQLRVDNAANTLSGVQALKQDVLVLNHSATRALDELVISDKRTAEFYTGDVVNSNQEASISVSARAEFGSDTTLKANFTLESTAALFIADTVTLGSELVLESGARLEGAAYDQVLTLSDIGTSVVLFDSVDKLTLANGSVSTSYLAGELTTESRVLASTYFANLSSRKNLYLTFDSAAYGQVCITMGEVIPEPTTATLSLLALAGLAARRRRRE